MGFVSLGFIVIHMDWTNNNGDVNGNEYALSLFVAVCHGKLPTKFDNMIYRFKNSYFPYNYMKLSEGSHV